MTTYRQNSGIAYSDIRGGGVNAKMLEKIVRVLVNCFIPRKNCAKFSTLKVAKIKKLTLKTANFSQKGLVYIELIYFRRYSQQMLNHFFAKPDPGLTTSAFRNWDCRFFSIRAKFQPIRTTLIQGATKAKNTELARSF